MVKCEAVIHIESEAAFFQAEERTLGAELQKSCRGFTEVTHVWTIGAYKNTLNIVFTMCGRYTICRRESQIKEELMVSNDVMRLEVKRLRDTLNGAADEVFSLENRRQQLGMSMKERKAEIQVILTSII